MSSKRSLNAESAGLISSMTEMAKFSLRKKGRKKIRKKKSSLVLTRTAD